MCLFFGAPFHVNAQKHTGKAIVLHDFIKETEQLYQVSFLYNSDSILIDDTLFIHGQQENLEERLQAAFNATNIDYKIVNRHVVLIKSNKAASSFKPSIGKVIITGRVLDSKNGTGVLGATIVSDKSNQLTITNSDGFFKLDLPDGKHKVSVSYLGFNRKSFEVSKDTHLIILLEEEVYYIDEVVKIGYGAVHANDVTGALTYIENKDLIIGGNESIDKTLQGKAGGLFMARSSGRPGSTNTVRIRGLSTINNSDPLYILDGMPLHNPFNSNDQINHLIILNPDDIQSIQILKDASSAAIYGSRAANGVVILNTKKGSFENNQFNLNVYRGTSFLRKQIDVFNTSQYIQFYDSLYNLKTKAIPFAYTDPENLKNNTNWQEEISRPAKQEYVSLSFSGGSTNSRQYLSGTYLNQEGILSGTGIERFNFMFSNDVHKGNLIEADNSINMAYVSYKQEAEGFYNALKASPLMAVYDDANLGGFAGPYVNTTGGNTVTNVLAENSLQKDNTNFYNVLGNTQITLKILPKLDYRFHAGVDLYFIKLLDVMPPYDLGSGGNTGIRGIPPELASIQKQMQFSNNLLFEHILNYQLKLKNHSFQIMAAHSTQKFRKETLNSEAFEFNEGEQIFIRTEKTNSGTSETFTEWKLLSYIGQLLYDYDNFFYLNASIRTDGSSRFGPNNRFGTFPSISSAIKLEKLPLFASIEPLNAFKIRAGFGLTGNQEIGDYGYLSLINTSRTFYVFGKNQYGRNGTVFGGAPLLSFGNKDIQWERTSQTNIGLDIVAFNNKLSFSFDYFYKTTEDMLIKLPLSGLYGGLQQFAEPFVNAGKIKNTGTEWNVGYQNRISGFKYNINFNLSTLKNEVVDLKNQYIMGGFNGETRTEEGLPIGSFYGYIVEGIFQTEEEIKQHAFQSEKTEPGDFKFKDLNHDNIINTTDRTFIGKAMPTFIYGSSLGFEIYNFDFNILVQGITGNKRYNLLKRELQLPTNLENMVDQNKSPEALNYWRNDNKDTNIPRISENDAANSNGRVSSRWIEDGSYLRIRNIVLGYTINNRNKLINLTTPYSIRIYGLIENAFTLTNYSGLDPEPGDISRIGNGGAPIINFGIDDGAYPLPISYIIGLQVQF